MRKPLPGSSTGSTCIASQNLGCQLVKLAAWTQLQPPHQDTMTTVTLKRQTLTSTKSGRLFHQV